MTSTNGGSVIIMPRRMRCAVYTRKSSEEGLDMEFNSLDAQREACEAYISSQRAEGWVTVRDQYDDGGFLRSSSARSSASAFATSSPPRARRACGWAGSSRSATTSTTASWC